MLSFSLSSKVLAKAPLPIKLLRDDQHRKHSSVASVQSKITHILIGHAHWECIMCRILGLVLGVQKMSRAHYALSSNS